MKTRPSIHLLSFFAVLVALWYAATSQGNAVAYVFLFLAVAMASVSIVHGSVNFRGLHAMVAPGAYGYAGRPFALTVRVNNSGSATRWGLAVAWRDGPQEWLGTVTLGALVDLRVGCKGLPRGSYSLKSCTVRSGYPFGLLNYSIELPLKGNVDVYPEPRGVRELPFTSEIVEAVATGQKRQGDDFGGFRPYRPGDSQRHVDWRAVARNQPMNVKQFEGAIGGLVLLDLERTPGAELESKLSQLALWIEEAEKVDVEYGLSLGATKVSPSKGIAHQHACLRALARYPAV